MFPELAEYRQEQEQQPERWPIPTQRLSEPGRIRTRPSGHPTGCVSKMPATCIVVPDLKSSPGPQPGQGADKIYPEKFSRTPESSAKKVLHRGRAGVHPGVRESFLEEAAPVPNCRAVKRGRNQAGRGRWEGAPGGAQARRLAKPWHAWGQGGMRARGRAGTGGGQPGAPACLYLVCPGRGGRGLPF